ncbi:MAG: 4Fe-4S binding protein [Dehalococcoidia bacterium]|nr:4Fe-4S binding protein [Dehalococcoidia bacterium]
MRVNEDTCIGCGQCVLHCTVGAISLINGVAHIDSDECVECGVCYRFKICPVDAIVEEELAWPRQVRADFSNPTTLHKTTGLAGRGTEEMKTNEVTGRFQRGWVGLGLEFGRPGIGTRLRDVDKASRRLAALGAHFEPQSPVTILMEDVKTGKLREDVLDEKCLSAIIECALPMEKIREGLLALSEIANEVETVFTVDCINVAEPDESLPMDPILQEMGIPRYPNGKTNVGLGRPVYTGDAK